MLNKALMHYLEQYLTDARREKFHKIVLQRTKHFTVAIEDVYQLHNTSAVLRSCDVFGIQEVNIIEEHNVKKIDREIAMGSQKWVDVNRYHSVKRCISDLKARGYQIVATTPHTNTIELMDFDINQKSCFFFGRETEGLSEVVMNNADCYLKIPMVGFTESLNVSVSAAIILQQLTYRLRQSDIHWQLTEEEQLQKRLDWCRKTLKSSREIEKRFYEHAD